MGKKLGLAKGAYIKAFVINLTCFPYFSGSLFSSKHIGVRRLIVQFFKNLDCFSAECLSVYGGQSV